MCQQKLELWFAAAVVFAANWIVDTKKWVAQLDFLALQNFYPG